MARVRPKSARMERPLVFCKWSMPTPEEIEAAPPYARWVNESAALQTDPIQIEHTALQRDGSGYVPNLAVEVYTRSEKIREAYEARGYTVHDFKVDPTPVPAPYVPEATEKAKEYAKKHGIDLVEVGEGTGRGGVIILKDVKAVHALMQEA